MAYGTPVIAQVHRWVGDDTITAHSSVEDTDYPLSNIKTPLLYSAQQSRITPGANFDGWEFELDASATVYCVGLLATDLVATERLTVFLSSAAPYDVAFKTLDANYDFAYPSDVYTGQTATVNEPVNYTVLCGYDFLSTGPSVPVPAVLDSVTCQSGRLEFRDPVSRTAWRLGFLALGINAVSLPHISEGSFRTEPKDMNVGTGLEWAVSWNRLPQNTFQYLQTLVATEQNWPVFFYPAPGGKGSIGTLAAAQDSPQTRGGLVRLLSVTGRGSVWTAGAQQEDGVTLACETWQETRLTDIRG